MSTGTPTTPTSPATADDGAAAESIGTAEAVAVSAPAAASTTAAAVPATPTARERKVTPRPSTPVATTPRIDNPLMGRVARRAAQVRPTQSVTFEVRENQLIQISDQLGRQVAVMIGFNMHDHEETLSPAQTRIANNALFPRVGDGLYSSRHRRMLTLIADTVGRHDTLMPMCTAERYLEDYGIAGHTNCRDTMAKALIDRKHEIASERFPDPINWFGHVGFFGRAELDIREPISERGDNVLLRAHMDLLLVVAASPNDQNAMNGHTPTDLLVRVYQ